jgi:LPXTG-motif cell wall-anchored protein
MFKKIFCLALALVMMMGMAAVGFSAAQVEIADVAADADAATTGADDDVATTGDGSKIYFNTEGTGWKNFSSISFHIWAIDDDSFEGFNWNAKSEKGVDEGNGVWSYDISSKITTPMQDSKQYCVIFYNDIGMQTYNLLMGTPCFGKTAACDGTVYENPEDSNKTAQAAFWGGGIDSKTYGPELKISSIGTVVGTCCAASTSPYSMFVDFLKNTLENARTYSGKDDQALLDDTAAALGLGQDLIEKAIKEANVTVEWKKDNSKAPAESDASATKKGDGTVDDSANPSGDDSSNDNTSDDDAKKSDGSGDTTGGNSGGSSGGNSGGSSSSSKSGSASNTQTGQTEDMIFIMLGVMVVAAGVIFFARKRERA